MIYHLIMFSGLGEKISNNIKASRLDRLTIALQYIKDYKGNDHFE